jgi:hypothetical protein
MNKKQILYGISVLAAVAIIAGIVIFIYKSKTTQQSTTNTSSSVVNSAGNLSQTTKATVTIKAEIWADNWFALYNGETLIKEDTVPITTEKSFNSETFTFTATYPVQLNLVVKDYKQNDTGLEYIGTPKQQIGDGGMIAQFRDTATGKIVATTTNKAKSLVVHKAPLDENCAKESNPVAGSGTCLFTTQAEPDNWKTENFNDASWNNATEFTTEEIGPKDGYNSITWDPTAKFIWSLDLKKDNTVLIRLPQITETLTSSNTLSNCNQKIALFTLAGNKIKASCEGEFLVVESDGLAQEMMMVGITAWQQQVPLAQNYTGTNSYKIPLIPVASSTPTITSGVGAVAIALNGVPIFNPSKPSQGGNQTIYDPNNDPKLVGELDVCGGHSGKGDDYHYHAGPVCFLDALGGKTGGVVGFALDGYKILEFHDAGEIIPKDLDSCNGHEHSGLGYHYHITERAPYVIGCFHGVISNTFQPETLRLRPPGGPIDAKITSLTTDPSGITTLNFSYNNSNLFISYKKVDDCYEFTYSNPLTRESPGSGTQTYCPGANR